MERPFTCRTQDTRNNLVFECQVLRDCVTSSSSGDCECRPAAGSSGPSYCVAGDDLPLDRENRVVWGYAMVALGGGVLVFEVFMCLCCPNLCWTDPNLTLEEQRLRAEKAKRAEERERLRRARAAGDGGEQQGEADYELADEDEARVQRQTELMDQILFENMTHVEQDGELATFATVPAPGDVEAPPEYTWEVAPTYASASASSVQLVSPAAASSSASPALPAPAAAPPAETYDMANPWMSASVTDVDQPGGYS